MTTFKSLTSACVALLGLAVLAPHAEAASKPTWTKNCTELNKKFPHGVGKAGAVDHVSSGTPVTTFTRSNKLYKQAIAANAGLDRDHDKVACEKA